MKNSFVKLKDVAKLEWGNTSITKSSYVEVGFPAFSAAGGDGYLNHAEFEEDGIVLSAIGARCGKCFKAYGKWTAIKNTITIIPNKDKVDLNYLFTQLNDDKSWKISGAAQPFITLAAVRDRLIQLPPLAEQQRVAALLDTADRVLKLRESAIAKLDQLAQSLFFQIDQTASKHYKLSDISEIVSGATPKTEIKEYWNGNVYWATPAELGKLNDIFINQTVRRITNKGLASCTATLLPINSVLFSSRAPIGHIAINSVPMATNQGFKSFVVDKQLVQPLYLYYWFKQNKLLLQSIGVGATFKELSKNLISEVKIKLPSINDQNKFVNQVNNIRDLKIKNLRAIKEIRNLIASLQHQSFTVN
jgi:type I restriction enzyme S subunit